MELFKKQTDSPDFSELDIVADRELATRAPWAAFLMLPAAGVAAWIGDLYLLEPRATMVVCGLFLALGILHLTVALRFKSAYRRSPATWRSLFYSAVILRGLTAGLIPPLVYFNHGTGWPFIISLIAVCSVSSGAIGILSPRLTLMQVYISLAILPSTLALMIWGNSHDFGLSILTTFFLAQVFLLGRYIHRQYWRGHHRLQLLVKRAGELAKANAQVSETNNNQSEFLATMSREMRGPLNGIMGLVDLALTCEDPQISQQHLRDIRSTSKNLVQSISEIIDYSDLEKGQRQLSSEPFDLTRLMQRIAVSGDLACRSRGNTLTLDLDPTLPDQVVGDEECVRQILQNLVDNAVQNTDLGQIEIKVKLDNRKDGLAGFTVAVKDTGIGIAPEEQEKIFQAYHVTGNQESYQQGNNGLGLTVSRQLAELMGGIITCESVPGQGSTFLLHLTLPEIFVPKDVQLESVDNKTQDLSGLMVLVVEDNTVNAKLTTRLLEKSEMKYDWARNGQEAVEMYLKSSFDMILMDIQMPILDGFGATKAIREAEKATGCHVPIIALTAHAIDGYRELCIESGMNDYLTKPVQPKALREAMQKWAPERVS